MVFSEIDGLKKYLKRDAAQFSLNPVRFINVDSMAMWIEVKKHLLSIADESMPLSSFCEDSDTTPNINRLNSCLKHTTKSQFVTPLSEYLRIVPEQAERIIQKIIKMNFENNDDGLLRVYFLMYRMKSLLITLPNDDPRAKDCVNYLDTGEENDYKLTIIQKDLGVRLLGNEIYGFKSYLEYWEANPDKPLILHTENAIHFEKNHFFDDVHVIVSSFDLIKYQYSIPSGIYEDLGSTEEWDELAKVMVKGGTFENACCISLQINRYSNSLLGRWRQLNAYQQWILWLWARNQASKDYEVICAKNCINKDEFIDELYCHIISRLDVREFDSEYKQRKAALAATLSVPTENFWNALKQLEGVDALKCLTDLTDVERKQIFTIIKEFSFEERQRVLPVLRTVYPRLYYYLGNDDSNCNYGLSQVHEKYFSEYKWLKVTDSITKGFIDKVKSIAIEKGESVFAMKPRNYYVTSHYDDLTMILFVDGMGVEYVDYLRYLFSDLDDQKYSVTIETGFCTLPSVTEINKDFMDNRMTVEPPIRELDELKHANNVFPESIIKQLSILDQIKDRVLGLLLGDTRRIIIASDHGTSRLAVKVRETEYDVVLPKPENRGVYKYGRFCEGTEDEEQYPSAICYNDKLIFADYTRFIQSGAPIDEIHGGASLEEWIVPIVTVEKYGLTETQTVSVNPVEVIYKPNIVSKKIVIRFTISGPKRTNVEARVNGSVYKCKYNSDGEYTFEYTPGRNDNSLNVKIVDGGIIGRFNIKVEQGIKKNTKFDI